MTQWASWFDSLSADMQASPLSSAAMEKGKYLYVFLCSNLTPHPSPLRRRGEMFCVCTWCLVENEPSNTVENCRDVPSNVVIPNTQNAVSSLHKIHVAPRIMFTLIPSAMHTAINFDDCTAFCTEKIRDERTDIHLPFKLETMAPAITQHMPEK